MPELDTYEVCIAQISGLVLRRQWVTTTYLTVNTALVGGLALLCKDGQVPGLPQRVSFAFLLFVGIISAGLWRKLITQYSQLLDWWYRQFRAVESTTKTDPSLFTKEYVELYSEGGKKAPI